jgi:hypothetical protein
LVQLPQLEALLGVLGSRRWFRCRHGSVSRRTWRYCEKHNRMISEKGSATSCAANVCPGKKRERFEFCFTYTKDGKTLRSWPRREPRRCPRRDGRAQG